ncbi:SDR family oxidoreductase [Alteromonas oceanisediminis]|uniref:SDR family oxidoreductase n=1 Tax=Alteromonas oceanisediminis TaxID=2836180 RepID=UPI001BD93548|nr:SDR family oxidoreductase [Alteromonas oceanisediminis]MBT0586258.1 SDR family oxidoreductase [Alteromonas oceanisediminis]
MKAILITGCSSGFGFDAAKYLASAGHHVYATMRNTEGKNASSAQALHDYAQDNDVKIDVLELDVTSDDSVAEAFTHVSSLDVVINNAGLGYGGPIEAFSSQAVLAQLDLNIVGTMRVAKAALPLMRAQQSGLIIQVSSTAGRGAFPGFGVYHASKWGLEGFSEAMRYELAPLGIDVAIVESGPFSTSFFANVVKPSDEEIASAYEHITQFMDGFAEQVTTLFEDENAPTDPMIVVKTFEHLINQPVGSRPLRTIAGLDFGLQKVNDAVEPIRKDVMQQMGIGEWDGPAP